MYDNTCGFDGNSDMVMDECGQTDTSYTHDTTQDTQMSNTLNSNSAVDSDFDEESDDDESEPAILFPL